MRVVVTGAGVAGATAALALARQGHRVRVLDRDDGPRPAAVADAADWERRGVAHFGQPHALLARLHAELAAGLPDVLEALSGLGVPEVPLPDGLRSVWCRRTTLEWVLRRTLEAEPGVQVRTAAVAGVETAGGAVSGVRLADGEVVPAELVVDASGRRGRLSAPWLRVVADEPADEVYTSRRYRLLPGAHPGPVNRGVISVAEGDGYAVLVFPHDAGAFSVSVTRLPDDAELGVVRELASFEAAVRAVPLTAVWTDPDRARPESGVMVMGGLRNTLRTLDEAAPLGLHPLGDAVCTTNPHFGRGCSLAVAHALRLAGAVAAAPDDARAWRTGVQAWEQGELRAWFEDARAIDRARAAVWRAVRDGRSPALEGGPDGRLPTLLVLAAAGVDPLVGRAVLRHMHMADPPAALEAVHPRVAELLAAGWAPGRPAPGVPGPTAGFVAPPRSRLVEQLTAVAAAQPA